MKILSRLLSAHRTLLFFVIGTGLLTVLPSPQGWGQSRPRKPQTRRLLAKPPRVQNPTPGNGAVRRNAPAIDPQVWALLTKMYRPDVDYEGVEVSNTNGMSSEETIQGDTKGRTRRVYQSPSGLAGNILLTMPNQYYNYNHQEHRLYLALWPVELSDKAARLRMMAKAGRVRIQITGEQKVAGRDATLITISSTGGGEEGEARRVLSLDRETGILLQMDRYNSASRLISSTYLRSVTIGATLDPQLFNPNALPSVPERIPLFPKGQPMFASVDLARPQTPFTIKEPTQLPTGFTLDGVWVFGPKTRRPSILLRYSSGVNHFSLFENLVPINPNAPEVLLRPGERRPRRTFGGWAWRTVVPEGQINILYTGHLPEAEQELLFRSLQ